MAHDELQLGKEPAHFVDEAGVLRLEADARIATAALEERRDLRIKRLSGGQRQRVAERARNNFSGTPGWRTGCGVTFSVRKIRYERFQSAVGMLPRARLVSTML